MPRRTKHKTRGRRRKRWYKGPNPRRLIGFPTSSLYKFRYGDTGELVTGLGGSTTRYVYSASNLNDPDSSGIGHQPLGYDQASTYYNRYMVIGAKITVKFAPDMDNDNFSSPVIVGCYLSDDATAPTSAINMIEQGLGKYTLIAGTKNRGSDFQSISITYSPKRFFKVKDPMDNQDEYGAPIGANPNNNAFFIPWIANLSPTALDNTRIGMLVVIEYTAIMLEPKSLPQS